MRNDWNDRPEADPFLDRLSETLATITDNFEQRQVVRITRGDNPLPGAPFITVTVETEHRTYQGRVFAVHATDTTLDLYGTGVTNPRAEQANPARVVRASSIVAAHVEENPEFLPVEIPMTKADLDAHIEEFLDKADDIVGTGPGKYDLTSEQCSALVEAAKPVNDFIFNSTIGAQWDRYTRAVTARHNLGRHPLVMPATDKRLNGQVVNTSETRRTGIPLLMFLTHGVPVEFLYTETHKVALDAYASYVDGIVRRQRRDA